MNSCTFNIGKTFLAGSLFTPEKKIQVQKQHNAQVNTETSNLGTQYLNGILHAGQAIVDS